MHAEAPGGSPHGGPTVGAGPSPASRKRCKVPSFCIGRAFLPWIIRTRYGPQPEAKAGYNVVTQVAYIRVLNGTRQDMGDGTILTCHRRTAKENLKATNLALTSGVPSTSSPVALVRRTLAPRLSPAATQPQELATRRRSRLQHWHRSSHNDVLVW